MSFQMFMRWLGILPFLALALALMLQAFDPGRVMSRLRDQIFDFYQRATPREYVDTSTRGLPGVRYIDIDDESLALMGQWPWPRTQLAQLVARTRDAGAAVMVFDIVFAEPDRTSPDQIARGWPNEGPFIAAREALQALPSNDNIFAESIGTMKVVTGFILGGGTITRMPRQLAGRATAGGLDPLAFVPAYAGVVVNLEAFESQAAGNGALNIVPEPDGIVRRIPLLFNLNGELFPSASVEAVRLVGKPPALAVKTAGASGETSFGAASGIVAIKSGSTRVQTTSDGQLYIHYTMSDARRRIPAWRVLSGDFDPALLKGAIVYVGTGAAGLKDIRSTPLEAAIPGVEIQVQAVEQMLLGHTLARPDFAPGAELAYSFVLGLLIVFLVRWLDAYWIGIFAVVGIATAGALSWALFESRLWLVDPVGPTIVGVSAFLIGALVKFAQTESEKRYVRDAFALYLQDDVINELAADPDKLSLGGETRMMTVIFCDIRGFTPIAESYRGDPQGLTKLINRVLTPLSRAVLEHRGTIDKFMGDCVMAFWNAPLKDDEHARNACRTAVQMVDEMDKLNRALEEEAQQSGKPFRRIEVGIGINTGECVVGNMGSEQRFDYTVLGDAVNLAARIQTYSGNYGPSIAVSEDTVKCLEGEFATLPVDLIQVKGKDVPVRVFALLGRGAIAGSPKFLSLLRLQEATFEAMRAKDWPLARQKLAEGRAHGAIDEDLYDLYEERIDFWEKEPPGEGWDGAWRATMK